MSMLQGKFRNIAPRGTKEYENQRYTGGIIGGIITFSLVSMMRFGIDDETALAWMIGLGCVVALFGGGGFLYFEKQRKARERGPVAHPLPSDDPEVVPIAGMRIEDSHIHSGGVMAGAKYVHHADEVAQRPPASRDGNVELLYEVDPSFSVWSLLEFLQAVHDRTLYAHGTHEWTPIRPFVSMGVRHALKQEFLHVDHFSDVVHHHVEIRRVEISPEWTTVTARLEHLRAEATHGTKRWVRAAEAWSFRRASSSRSAPPAEMRSLGCPSCGSPVEVDPDGHCVICEVNIDEGRLQWQAVHHGLLRSEPLVPRNLKRTRGGEAASWRAPSEVDPDLETELRALRARRPEFRRETVEQRVRELFADINEAWNTQDIQAVGDGLFAPQHSRLHYEILELAANELVPHRADADLVKLELVEAGPDAWFEILTVRLWVSAREWVEDADGKVVSGNADMPARRSFYWTLLHPAGIPLRSDGWQLADASEA